MQKLFNLTTVATGAALGLIVAGVLAVIAGVYDRKVVRDQLVPQKIFFPEKGPNLPPELNEYAGGQVDTARRRRPTQRTSSGLTWRASERARPTPKSQPSS